MTFYFYTFMHLTFPVEEGENAAAEVTHKASNDADNFIWYFVLRYCVYAQLILNKINDL